MDPNTGNIYTPEEAAALINAGVLTDDDLITLTPEQYKWLLNHRRAEADKIQKAARDLVADIIHGEDHPTPSPPVDQIRRARRARDARRDQRRQKRKNARAARRRNR